MSNVIGSEIVMRSGTCYDVVEAPAAVLAAIEQVKGAGTPSAFVTLHCYSSDGEPWDGREFFVRADFIASIVANTDDE